MRFCVVGESTLGGSGFVDREKRDGGEAGGSPAALNTTLVAAIPGPAHPPLLSQMSLYLTFPVVMFWISNQAEWFEDYVIQRKRELWPREKEDQRQELEEFKQKIRKQREERLLQAAQQNS
ncbi:protein PET100 homolog, mitochondrial isoform X2 [Nannospalax galili]|uniref:protein PET100 homolog, mitochondrial isoform X2 n=1 Tax=Nannospalax galili TaxID=1026970 RepID=UPI00111C7F5D|nr:protein PET100 homolog, mitochondrial isoform X2 [Nannospalax galili]